MHLRPLGSYTLEELRHLAKRYNVKQSKINTRFPPGHPKRYQARTKEGLFRALQAMYVHHGRRDARCHRYTSYSTSRSCRTPYWL